MRQCTKPVRPTQCLALRAALLQMYRPRSACGVLAPAGAARVQQLRLGAAGEWPRLRRRSPQGAQPLEQLHDNDVGSATDAEFTAAARRCLRAHLDLVQQWVAAAVRGTKRSLRRKMAEIGASIEAAQILTECANTRKSIRLYL